MRLTFALHWLCSAALLGGAASCARTPRERGGSRDDVATTWHYRVRLDPALERLDAEVCFEGAVPRELRAGKSEGAERLVYARWLGPGPVRRLPVRRGRIELESPLPDGCVGYGIALREGGSTGAAVRRAGRDLIASPNAWLFRPERRAIDARATLELALPAGMSALLPWPQREGIHQLDAAAFRFDSYAAFGRFAPARAEHRGVQIEVALLDGELALDPEAAIRALKSTIDTLAQSAPPLPTGRISALLVPAGDNQEAVPFGMVARGGGASLLLLVSSRADGRAVARDWVLAHELSHLLMPFIEREQAWLSEGLATYYQELLRARAGVQSERAAFGRLARSMREAERATDDSSIVAQSARMHITHAYRQVYWGGAAFWLITDVALRSATQGHSSLDSVLGALRAEGALGRVWSAQAMLARLDALAGVAIFAPAYEEAEAHAFPRYEQVLGALGVRLREGELELDDAAPLAEIRRALVAPRR